MKKRTALRGAIAAVFAAAMVAPAMAADVENILTLTAPKDLKGVPVLPFTGEKVTFTTPDLLAGSITTEPNQGYVGQEFTLTGKGLPANADVTLTWSTADGAWLADVQPNSINYRGLKFIKYPVKMASVTTDANGGFSFKTKAPEDFGGPHDVYAVVNGAAVAKGGFQTNPKFTMSPSSGPVGTPITIKYTGIGSTLYTGGISVLWDNGFVGEAQAVWTRGTAEFKIRASGSVGTHYVTAADGIGVQYMNLKQSPVPFSKGGMLPFKVTKDAGLLPSSIDYPQVVTPTTEFRTTLSNQGVDPKTTAVAKVNVNSAVVGTKVKLDVTGLATTGTHQIVWASVVGNRVNCSGTCWVYNAVPMGSATPVSGSISTDVTIPDHLGGWHVIQIKSGDMIEAQVPFYVKPSIFVYKDKAGKALSAGVALADKSPLPEDREGSGKPTYTFKAGEEITIAMKGVGWTQLDNTMAVTYDNSYIGYGCGFNSNGYMVIHLPAVGQPGTHIIDLHPLFYTNQPSFASTPYGMLPILSFANDNPAIALGYQLPAVHFSIKIVK
jgi:hypothetical protein